MRIPWHCASLDPLGDEAKNESKLSANNARQTKKENCRGYVRGHVQDGYVPNLHIKWCIDVTIYRRPGETCGDGNINLLPP